MEDHEDKERGHTQSKIVTIIINGQRKEVNKGELSFEEIVILAALPSGPDTIFTVTYRNGHGGKPSGSMVAGDNIRVKDGMIFNVTPTGKS